MGAEGRGLGHGDAVLGDAALRRGGGVRPRGAPRRLAPAADRHLGHSPEDVAAITGVVPDPAKVADENKRASMQRALDYMGLTLNAHDRHPARRRLDRPERPHRGPARRRQDRGGPHDLTRLAYAMIVPGSGW